MTRRDSSACNYILLSRKNGLLWVAEELVEGDASLAHCSAYLEKQHWVIFADGELNHGGVPLVRGVLEVDADDLLAAPPENFLVLVDVPRHGVHVVGVDHREHGLSVRLDILEDLGERHGWKEEEQEEEAQCCVFCE